MLGSLRVRLPLVFLAGIILAGLVTTLIAVRLFRDFAHDQALTKLSREAHGIAALYAEGVTKGYGNTKDERAPTKFTAESLEKATGDELFFIGPHNLYPGQITGLRTLPRTTFDWISGKSGTFEFTPPGTHRRYYAVANPIVTGKNANATPLGAIVVATPKVDVSQRVYDLIGRLALAAVFGVLVSALLAWYLSRRIVRPVLQLSDAGPAEHGAIAPGGPKVG